MMKQIAIGLVFLLLGAGISKAYSVSFTVSGNARSELYLSNSVYHVETNWFVVSVSNRSCQISASVAAIPVVERFLFVSDGMSSTETAIFKKESLLTAPYGVFRRGPGERTNDLPIRPHSHAHLKATPWPMPSEGTGMLLPLWLAFCGSDIDPSNRTPLFFPDFFRAKRIVVKTSLQKNGRAPHFLSELIELDPGFHYEMIPDSVVRVRKRHSGFCRFGFTNAAYKVLAWTNAFGLELPREFEVMTFMAPPQGEGTSCPWLRGKYFFEVEAVKASEVRASELMQIPEKLRISDLRFAHDKPPVDVFDYLVTDGLLPSKSAVQRTEAYSSALKVTRGLRRNGLFRSWYGAAVVTMVIFPVVALVYNRLKTWSQQSKSTK